MSPIEIAFVNLRRERMARTARHRRNSLYRVVLNRALTHVAGI